MSRTTLLVLLALGATLAGFALSTNARRLQGDGETTTDRPAAGPQRASLDWRETFGEPGSQLVFTVHSLEVGPDGWQAHIEMENDSAVPWEIGGPGSAAEASFGLMLFSSGEESELEEQNESGTLPAVRAAVDFEPPLPPLIDPGQSWSGTISAPGPLVADSWARVVFGPLVSVGHPPEGLPAEVAWISDHAYRLKQ